MSMDRTPNKTKLLYEMGKNSLNGTYDGAGRHAVGHAPCTVNHGLLYSGSGLDEAMRADEG